MSRLTSRYRKHLTLYVNHHDLDMRLTQADRSKSIIAFLWLGLVFLVLGIVAGIIGALYWINQKVAIADWLGQYASWIIAQLPAAMTGEMVISGWKLRLHFNNDKAFVINLTKDMDEKMEDGHSNDIWLTVLVDTSLTTMPTDNKHKIIITQNAILMNDGDKSRLSSFDGFGKWEIGKNETIAITQEMIQSSPSQITPFIEEHMATIVWFSFLGAIFMIIIFGGLILVTSALWYFILCLIIRCLVSIVTSIAKCEIPHNKRDLICLLSFGPFIIHLFIIPSRIYIIAMTLYISILIYQHHQFHQKK